MNTDLMAELLGGASRYRVLRCLYGQPERPFRVRELAMEAGVDPGNTSRWLRRWVDVGLLESSVQFGQTVFRASGDPALKPLRALLQQDHTTVRVLREAVSQLGGGVHAAAIFGSVARGEPRPDSDIDLLLIADGLSRLQAQSHFKKAGRALGRPVNVLLYTLADWSRARSGGDSLVQDIASGDVIELQGDIHALAPTPGLPARRQQSVRQGAR
ncbi:MAG: nucleotidyltransferase domain-containing protein [Hydrogenophaga sp.]|uniref:MarR family transcriptional regulator n=1 Tax=Hydrogenophaga crocea TaxID=2716225 RepID=A0A6G8IH48_9BURK|nr:MULTISPECIES: nucleotidyltransferase domain-containing protein [Hydrogenophaga]MBL0945825.1 nucleotidyltransferase domain-containing protein [Hydrogenophaga sp.]QIM52527.1 MarR family transcriptional regulator [Hydrogenophaga crocea]